MTRSNLVLVGFLLGSAVSYAQESSIVSSSLPEISPDVLNSGEGAILVHAGTDKKIAFLRIKKRPLGKSGFKWDLGFQAPYDKDSDPPILGNFDGLTNSTNLELGFQRIDILSDPSSQASNRNVDLHDAIDKLCVQYGVPQGEGCTDDEVGGLVKAGEDVAKACTGLTKVECENRAKRVAEEFKKEELKIRQRLADEGKLEPLSSVIFGGTWKVGVQQFKYLDSTTLAEQKSNQSPWSLSTHYYYKRGANSIGAGIEYQESYKEQPSASVCQPIEGTPNAMACKDGRLGPPARQKRELIFVQFNHHRVGETFAFAPRVTHDFETDDTGIHLPIYLVRNEKGLFTGGLQIGWQSETKEVVAGFFVGKTFEYF